MSTLSVEEVRLEPDTGAGLAAAGIMQPRPGVSPPFSLLVRGWALGVEARVLAVELMQGGAVLRIAPVREPSPALARAHPDRPEAAHCEFITRIPPGMLDPRRELLLRAVLDGGVRAALGVIKLTPQPTRPPRAEGERGRSRTPTLKGRMGRLAASIAAARGLGDDGIPDTETLLALPGDPAGDRRIASLDAIELRGLEVLDLDAGAGHLARAARARGAALVDGLQPDEELRLVARLLNAYHGTTRVSFVAMLAEAGARYDVVLALGTPAAALDVSAVAALTGGVMLSEPGPAWEKLRAAFPSHRPLEAQALELVACAHGAEALERIA